MSNIRIVAEIGINHNGDIQNAVKLIQIAAAAGCDYVKFQKRTPELCVPEYQKSLLKETPWGNMTYLDYKNKLEFGYDDYVRINDECYKNNIRWFASVWDMPSVEFMRSFPDPWGVSVMKIPSALITDDELLRAARNACDTLIISTGMSTQSEVDHAIEVAEPDVVMHTNSSYPSPIDELNLNYLRYLYDIPGRKYQIGYSGHEYGLDTTFATIPLGVTWIERHVTLNHSMWGSDQLSSVEPSGLFKLVKGIREIERAFSIPPRPRMVLDSELSKRKTLRG